MGLFDFLKTAELAEIKLLNNEIANLKRKVETLGNQNLEAIAEIQKLKGDIETLGNQNLEAIIDKTDNYQGMTIGNFRSITNGLLASITDSESKTKLHEFLQLDLSAIDLARTEYELHTVERKMIMNEVVGVIGNGRINWKEQKDIVDSDLQIGVPKKRVEFYNEVINLMKQLAKK
jgi:hypothetical protein